MSDFREYLELRKDHGAAKAKALFWLLVLIATIFAVPVVSGLLSSGKVFAGPIDQFFFIGSFVVTAIGLILAFCWHHKRLKIQKQSPVILRIDDYGVHFGSDLGEHVSWKDVDSVEGLVRRDNKKLIGAMMGLVSEGEVRQLFDLKPLNSKPEKVIRFAKKQLRESRNVNICDLIDFGVPVRCPRCAQMTDSLKAIQSGMIIFLFFGHRHELHQYNCCQRCARGILLHDSIINLRLAI